MHSSQLEGHWLEMSITVTTNVLTTFYSPLPWGGEAQHWADTILIQAVVVIIIIIISFLESI
jgi:hypothetical protein